MKIFVSDLDQTLLDLDHELPLETIELVKQIRSKGYYFGIATGRPRISAEQTIPNISELFDFAVYENGGEVHDFHTNTVHIDHLLEKEVIEEIIGLGKEHDANPTVTHDGLLFTEDGDRYASYGPGFVERMRICNVLEILQDYHPKVIFGGTDEELNKLEVIFNSAAKGRYRAFKSANDILEIMHPEINKLAGIRWFLDNHNLSVDHLMTFGDNNNDVEMLKGSAMGIAVSNGTDLAKAAADKVIGSHVDNSVYHFLREYLSL